MTDSLKNWPRKLRKRIRHFADTTGHHFGLGDHKPLRGFPEGEALILESANHFTRVQVITSEPAETAGTRHRRRTFDHRWSLPPVSDPPTREFYVKVSAHGEWWEPGEELTPTPETTLTNQPT